ncbi:GNAT family N-acetyltransferase [Paenibacillus thermotolerans]|uniref:GNAT family N-acetyltransferase n=1 Tax=Paenibacillus thermotolerans TaxID=3027807 RepID=UPI002368EE3B|nr:MULTISPECIES: GNAT family N-acetyltransferase [unclassified Paenibacillus]
MKSAVREATDSDLPDILEIYNDAIMNTTAVYHYFPHTLEQRKEWFRQKREEGSPVLVCESGGKVAGFATYGPFRPWPAYKYTIEHSVYVRSDARRQGVATLLLKELLRIAEERGFATVVAGIDEDNASSILMHEKLGFSHAGTVRKAGYKFGRWLNLRFYQLELSGPSHPTEG